MTIDEMKYYLRDCENLPYKCILVDGVWGIGKTYAVDKALKAENNVGNSRSSQKFKRDIRVCYLSMFGLQDAQEIYHEILCQLSFNENNTLKTIITKGVSILATVSKEVETAKKVLDSFMKEKEVFYNVSKQFDKPCIIVIDDLERMKPSIELEEIFGVVEELKKCNYAKVILIANTEELKGNKEVWERYSEKVIDRIYKVTECSKEIRWGSLNIHDEFMTGFLNIHDVKNLRTLQKAQNLYDEVKMYLYDDEIEKEDKNHNAFCEEIKYACFGIVVEDIEKLYYEEVQIKEEDTSIDKVMQCNQEIANKLVKRVMNHYLQSKRMSEGMVTLLIRFYKEAKPLKKEEIETQKKIFQKAGEKPNFYKTEKELRETLSQLKNDIENANALTEVIMFGEEYIKWNRYLQHDMEEFWEEYELILHEKMEKKIIDNVVYSRIDCKLYEDNSFYINDMEHKKLVREIEEKIKENRITIYMEYLSKNITDNLAFLYSFFLREKVQSSDKKAQALISENINLLYTEHSLPIKIENQEQYRTIQNIMYILSWQNEERFKKFCEKTKTEHDKMVAYRIDCLLEGVERLKKGQ